MLTPKQAADRLTRGDDPVTVIADLDIDACRFLPAVEAGGHSPDVETGFAGFGSPVTGQLAFMPEEVSQIETQGGTAIRVQGTWTDGPSWPRTRGPRCYLLASGGHSRPTSWFDHHILVSAAYSHATLMDNPTRPVLSVDPRAGTLTLLESGATLRSGAPVTLDPTTGFLWRGHMPIAPPPDYTRVIENTLRSLPGAIVPPSLAFHSTVIWDLEKQERWPYKTALLRTEQRFRSVLLGSRNRSASVEIQNLRHDPACLGEWDNQTLAFNPGLGYRLVDVHSLRDLLPPDLVSQLDAGADHEPAETPLFRFRRNLYTGQLQQAFNVWAKRKKEPGEPRTIIMPNVTTTEEVQALKSIFDEVAMQTLPPTHQASLRFGVMIETPEALRHIHEIAPLCHALYFGTNDLTAGLTGLSRGQLDHTGWMRARGYTGRSPFEVLVPEVLAPVREAVAAARRANPSATLVICGHQVAGHHLPSTRAALSLGFDILTIPANTNSILRTQAAIVQHRQSLRPV